MLFKGMLHWLKPYIIFLAGALIILGLLFSCSDGGPSDPGLNGNGENGNGPANTPMEISVDVPEQYRLSDPPEHGFSVEDQDGISDGLITYSENDSTIWEKSLEGFSATRWDTAWTPAPEQHGEALLEYTIYDAFDGEKETRSGSAQIVILPLGNSPGSIEAEYSSFTADVESQIRFLVTDPDTLLEISFEETDSDGSTTSFTVQPMATHFDTTISRTYGSSGEAVWIVTASDKHPEQEVISEEFTIEVQEPGANTPATITANIPEVRAGQQAELSFSVSDPDTIVSVTLTETLPGGSENFFEASPESITWDTTITRTYQESGKVIWSVSATDMHPQPETTTKVFEVDVLAKMVSYTLDGTVTNPVLETPAIGVTARLYGPDGSLLDDAETDGQGVVSLAHTQPEDEPVEGFRIELQANGYFDGEESVNLNQESFSAELEPTPIEFSAATEQIEPRSSILTDLADLVFTDGLPLEEVSIERTTANLSAVQENGTTYRLSVENDVAATTESITIRARTSTNDQTGQVEVPIGERAFITITQSQFEVTEDDTLTLNLLDIVDSGADIENTHISSSSPQLEIIQDADGHYRLIPDKDFYGDLQVELYASNVHGSETTQSGTLQVERLPRATVEVVESDDNVVVNHAYLLVEDNERAVLDSLTSTSGVFSDVKLTASTAYLRAGELRGGQPYALEHRIHLEQIESDVEIIIAVFNREKRNINNALAGEFSEEDLVRLRGALREVNGNGPYQTFNNWEYSEGGGGGDFGDNVAKYAQSNNKSIPDEIILTNYLGFLHSDSEFFMEERTRNNFIQIYNEYYKPILQTHQPAPTFTEVDTLLYDKDNQPDDKLLLAPRGDIPAAGTISIYGLPDYTQKSSIATARSGPPRGKPSIEAVERRAISEELASALFWMGRLGNEGYLAVHESVINNDGSASDVTYPTEFDFKAARFITNPLYKAGTKYEDALIIPHNWK